MDGPEGEAHRLHGYAQYLNGNNVQAVQELTQAIALNDADAENFRLRGMVYRENESYKLSRRDLENAVALAPDDVESLVELAYTYDELWNFDDALEVANEAIHVSPKDVRALNYRAYILGCGPQHLLQPEQALKDALAANRLSGGESAAVLDTLACAYAALGDFPEAQTTAKLAIAKAEDDETVREDAVDHLELFKQQKAFRLPEDRPIDLETGPPVTAIADIDGAVDTSFVPAECFAALFLRPKDILSLPQLQSFSEEALIQPVLSEFGTNALLVDEILVPMFPSRELPLAFLLRFNQPFWPGRPSQHPILDVTDWKSCEYSSRECYRKLGRVTCFIDGHTVITGPRAAVKRMLAADDTPSPLRNALAQKKRISALLLQIEFSVCPNFIAAAAKQHAEETETAAVARFLPDAHSFSASLTTADHILPTGTAIMNDAVVASRLNLSLNEAFQRLQSFMVGLGYDAIPLPPAAISELKTINDGLLKNTTFSVSGSAAQLQIRTTNEIESALQSLGKLLAPETQ